MLQNLLVLPFANVRVTSVSLADDAWVVTAAMVSKAAACPRCHALSSARHSTYQRRLWDLPIQGMPVRIVLTVGRWRCRNPDCLQSVFAEPLPGIAALHSRRTERVAGIVRLLGHSAGGRPGERLAQRLGFAGSRAPLACAGEP